MLVPLKIRGKVFDFSRTYVMGIINVTEDSFYPSSRVDISNISKVAKQMEEEGADILDVGAESTRPGALPINAKEEAEKIVQAVKEIRKVTDLPISIDTYRASTAEAGIKAGADMINDISGLKFDPHMAKTIANLDVPVVVMHIKGTPRDMQKDPHYDDVIKEVHSELEHSIDIATKAGIAKEKIIIDPGIGFGKRLKDNLNLIAHLDLFTDLNLPILIGISRKSMINMIMPMDVSERLEPTIALNSAAVMKGANIVRVHDVRPHVKAMKMIDALKEVQK
ncbi:dihydropteroate synthase [Mesoaciditoga lauensis]|uniref:dihydropteroate synthase n=1 Tax=Mesoaciditoga lauensis TaxID=1495039 RepID=UPI000562E841|nr:dihydropteroate synthase [Mesoaciditoga lauensis]